jgi:hypothetical protein
MLRKLALHFRPDTQRRRILGDAVREGLLDCLELSEKLVVLNVRERRTIQDVVLVGRASEQSAQLRRPTIVLLAGLLRSRVVGAGIPGRFLLLL